MKKVYLLFLVCISVRCIAQTDTAFNKVRFKKVVVGEVAFLGLSIYGANELWYKNFPRTEFHFFNDNHEWFQMDKAGHAYTGYQIGRAGFGLMKWSRIENKEAAWYGGSLGFIYLAAVEVLDGFQSEYGFSYGDIAANAAGSLLFIGQRLKWSEERIILKASYHNTQYAQYRPEILGSGFNERLLKDYNGQTIWLSANIQSFLNKENKVPEWLNVAIGIGAEGMLGATKNPVFDKNGNTYPYFKRYRQLYISPDIDFTRIKTNSKTLRTVFWFLNALKFPAPAVEFSGKRGVRLQPVYF